MTRFVALVAFVCAQALAVAQAGSSGAGPSRNPANRGVPSDAVPGAGSATAGPAAAAERQAPFPQSPFGAAAPRPPAAPAQGHVTGRPVTFRAVDGRTVTGTLFETAPVPAPAVVLVPALGHPRDEWQAVAQHFAELNINALTIDLPGAVLPDDPKELAGWSAVVRAAVGWLTTQPAVRGSAIGVAGASLGASLGALAAANEPQVRALALVSPSIDYRGLRIEAPMRQYGARPLLLVASRHDPYAFRSVRDLAGDGSQPRETFLGETASHGVPLLTAEPDLARMLVDWFQRTLGVH